FTAVREQRALLLAGSLSAVLGLVALATGRHDTAGWWLIGSCIVGVVIPPFLTGPLLRNLSAMRTVELIPHGRLQLLMGSFLAELFTAAIPALVFAMIAAQGAHERAQLATDSHSFAMLFATIFVSIFAAATVAFVTLYYGSASQFGILAPIVVISVFPVVARTFPQLHIEHFPTSASDLSITYVGALGVWSLFGALYLRAGRIAPSVWGRVAVRTEGGGAIAPPRWLAGRESGVARELSSQRDAMRALLTGSHPGAWGGIAYPVLATTAGSLAGFALVAAGSHRGGLEGSARFIAAMVAYS